MAHEGDDLVTHLGDVDVDVAAGGEVDTRGDSGGLLPWPSAAPRRGA